MAEVEYKIIPLRFSLVCNELKVYEIVFFTLEWVFYIKILYMFLSREAAMFGKAG